jgi:phytoene synthase
MKARRKDTPGAARKPDFEEILKNPILDIAARFWDGERYEAFKVCYSSMRVIDNLVDDRKATGIRISEPERERMTGAVMEWLNAVGGASGNTSHMSLVETRARFLIPPWPWQRLARSMIYDINHDGFKTFPDFRRYSEGAAVAPASVFMHLCGVTKKDEQYVRPGFDVRKAARPLALFCYIVHIIRDFQKDQSENLNYFAENFVAEYGLDRSMLKDIARGGGVKAGFRSLMARYYGFAEFYRRKAALMIEEIAPCLEHRYLLSLRVIYSLYLQIFERVDVKKGGFTTEELNPSPKEVRERIELCISSSEKG